jgi:hypothetical protein
MNQQWLQLSWNPSTDYISGPYAVREWYVVLAYQLTFCVVAPIRVRALLLYCRSFVSRPYYMRQDVLPGGSDDSKPSTAIEKRGRMCVSRERDRDIVVTDRPNIGPSQSTRRQWSACSSLPVPHVLLLYLRVGIATGYVLRGRNTSTSRGKISSLLHPASYPVGTGCTFSGGKSAWAWSWPLTSN